MQRTTDTLLELLQPLRHAGALRAAGERRHFRGDGGDARNRGFEGGMDPPRLLLDGRQPAQARMQMQVVEEDRDLIGTCSASCTSRSP